MEVPSEEVTEQNDIYQINNLTCNMCRCFMSCKSFCDQDCWGDGAYVLV